MCVCVYVCGCVAWLFCIIYCSTPLDNRAVYNVCVCVCVCVLVRMVLPQCFIDAKVNLYIGIILDCLLLLLLLLLLLSAFFKLMKIRLLGKYTL